jgi:DNA replication protein DnaC
MSEPAQLTAEPYTGPRHDWDAIGQAYLARAKKRTAITEWVRAVPYSLRRSNWQHAELARSDGQIRKILGWSDSRVGLLASGPSGLGKSRAMWALMLKLAKRGKEIRYFTASEFFSDMQARVNYGRDDAGAWIKAVAGVPIVFIDDLGQEAMQTSKQDWAKSWFFQFLDMRSGKGLPLFVTTNMSARDMADGMGDLRGHPLLRRLLMVSDPVKFGQ